MYENEGRNRNMPPNIANNQPINIQKQNMPNIVPNGVINNIPNGMNAERPMNNQGYQQGNGIRWNVRNAIGSRKNIEIVESFVDSGIKVDVIEYQKLLSPKSPD